ncbi:AAA family ATPase [Pseudenhygromyxa sp. WMMC2535]|nr:AAA family ATPase [Pseudenhygromyxa sp. WMMC2535]
MYQAARVRDGQEVIAKVFDLDGELAEDRAQHEFELIRGLDIDGVVRALELKRVGEQMILVFERVPGVNLAEHLGGEAMTVARFWSMAIELAELLAKVHAAKVVHRDVKPTNILIAAGGGRVHLADFGISVLLEGERRQIYDDEVFVGTLPYISPEQTGRTSHAVDFRSDLYSLGVTFYEALTGRRPFESVSPLEIIHAHLAERPRPVELVNPELPVGLSRIVDKLLAKAPEHRYQTAAGLAVDLRKLRAAVEAGDDGAQLELGLEDYPDALNLPHQLYGRGRERALLGEHLAAVVEGGGRRSVALIGPAGIGKTALVSEIEAAVAGYGGYLIRGEFGVESGDPDSGLGRALTALFEQLLTESDARLARWRELLGEGLGVLAGVLVELAPTLELIIGPQRRPPPVELGAARNRLEIAVERLFTVISGSGRPLVVAFDDLQRASQGSVELVEGLLRGELGPMLVIAAWRDDGLGLGHPLRDLEAAFAAHPRGERVRLSGLSKVAVEALLRDALPGSEGLEELAKVIVRKTNGVPTFVGQLLVQLGERGLLRLEEGGVGGRRGWRWELEAIEAEPIPDDAVEMMCAKLEALGEPARELLRRAACVGPSFEIERLSSICAMPREQLSAQLCELEDVGLLLRIGEGYRFIHDSVRDAASRGLDEGAHRRLRWTIGQAAKAELERSEERLLEIVDHLDAGAPDGLALPDRLELAALDLRAGKRAMATVAFERAEGYLRHGVAASAELCAGARARGSAAPGYALSFELAFTLARVIALSGRRAAADEALINLLDWKLDDADYAQVVAKRIELLWADSRHHEAAELGLGALERLGYAPPAERGLELALASIERAWSRFRGRSLAQLQAMPRCEDPRAGGVLEIFAKLIYPVFVIDNLLFLQLIAQHVELCAGVGLHETTAKALSDLSVAVSGGLGRCAEAAELHALACELAESRPNSTSEAWLLAMGGALSLHRVLPFAELVSRFELGFRRGFERGELEAASFVAGFGVSMLFEIGTHLRTLDRRCRQARAALGGGGSLQMEIALNVARGACRALAGQSVAADDGQPDACAALLGGEAWLIEPQRVFALGSGRMNYYVAEGMVAMIQLCLGEPAAAFESCARVLDIETVAYNTSYVARNHTLLCASYYILTLAGERPGSAAAAAVPRCEALIERWAEDCPANYAHYRALVWGLRHGARGEEEQALVCLDRAWQQARRQGCRWIEGVAAEQLAASFERRGLHAAVDGIWRRAWEAYEAWGAEVKLARLRAEHPAVFGGHSGSQVEGEEPGVESRGGPRLGGVGEASSTGGGNLDLARVLHSVGSITEDLRLEEVIERLLEAAVTHAGADHGLLILDRGGELSLVAESRSAGGEQRVDATLRPLRSLAEAAPVALINLANRSGHAVVIDDLREDLRFVGDPYLEGTEVRSALALPLAKGERPLGVLVLENHLTTHGFSATTLEALRLITAQAASTLENAQLYAALRRSEGRWRSLVDGAPDLIALLDEQGEVVFRNHGGALQGIRGLDGDGGEAARGDEEGALERGSARRWREAVLAVLERGERRELELEYHPREGGARWYAVRLAPIAIHDTLLGACTRRRRNAVAVATDISARKQAEADKRTLEAQLRQQQRLESVGTLASGVAHEINNPIQGIMNYADLIYGSPRERGLVEDFALEIIRESQRVAKIVRNLLAFSRQDAREEPELVQLDEIVESSLLLIRSVLRRNHIMVEFDAKCPLPPVRCRSQQIQQVILNLVTNARDALESAYGQYDERKRIEISIDHSMRDGWVCLAVRDWGPGIPDEVLPRIFDPFFTTKGRDQGTGLGLAVSHGIVQEHGGQLEVETRPDYGTRFSLELPAVDELELVHERCSASGSWQELAAELG